ncbi:MAG: two-component system, NarL family, invasion response regulator UvrY [bacterium]|jgi:DNA-binding NarL/FixJ family response regulator
MTVDDEPAFLSVARDVILATPGFEAVGEALTGEDGIALVPFVRPQLVLMDVRMPGMGGIEASRRIGRSGRGRIAVLLMSADPQAVMPDLIPSETMGVVAKDRLCPRSLTTLWADWLGRHALGAPR